MFKSKISSSLWNRNRCFLSSSIPDILVVVVAVAGRAGGSARNKGR